MSNNETNLIVDKQEFDVELAKKTPWKIPLEVWQKREVKSIDDFFLRPKQKQFLEHYIKRGGNGKKAWMAVYDCTNEGTARAEASEELAKPNVKAALQWLLRETCSKESVIAKFEELREDSPKEIQLRANEALAKMHALFIDKQIEKTVETVHYVLPSRGFIDVNAHESDTKKEAV